MASRYDLAVVGAGIVGLAHAYAAARRGWRVGVFERYPRAQGASVRNFGMLWPIGQPHGAMLEMALRSRARWLEVLEAARLPYAAAGSLHAAYRADEAAVGQEFAELGPAHGYEARWLDARQALARSNALVHTGLQGALWSPLEVVVDPRLTLAVLPEFLREQHGVEFHFGVAVSGVELPWVTAGGGRFEAERVLVCAGDDFETLYPGTFAASGLTRVKLQMLRTAAQPGGWRLGPALAAGLTLRFYPSFAICPSLAGLAARIGEETPEYDRWGIHGLVSQTADGCLTLGDSHEYGLAVDIFNKEEIDGLMLRYIGGFLRAPDMTIAQRWQGVYAKHPEQAYLRLEPAPGVAIVTSPGGSGMTLSFGLAEATLAGWAG